MTKCTIVEVGALSKSKEIVLKLRHGVPVDLTVSLFSGYEDSWKLLLQEAGVDPETLSEEIIFDFTPIYDSTPS